MIILLHVGTSQKCQLIIPKDVGRCKPISKLCTMPKTSKYGTLAPMHKGLKREYRSTNSVEQGFWFCLHDIKRYVNGSKKKYVLDWHVVSNIWPVKINTNFSRHETDSQRCLVSIATKGGSLSLHTFDNCNIPNPSNIFVCSTKVDAHPISRFGKTMRLDLATSMVYHNNKWERNELMDG